MLALTPTSADCMSDCITGLTNAGHSDPSSDCQSACAGSGGCEFDCMTRRRYSSDPEPSYSCFSECNGLVEDEMQWMRRGEDKGWGPK